MSANPTRQHPRPPLHVWSPVVLLSALLLSPMTAGALWHALAERFPQVFAALNDGAAVSDTAPFATGSAISEDDTAHAADANDETRRETAEVPRRVDLPPSASFFFAPDAPVYPCAASDSLPAFDGGSVSGRAPPVLG